MLKVRGKRSCVLRLNLNAELDVPRELALGPEAGWEFVRAKLRARWEGALLYGPGMSVEVAWLEIALPDDSFNEAFELGPEPGFEVTTSVNVASLTDALLS